MYINIWRKIKSCRDVRRITEKERCAELRAKYYSTPFVSKAKKTSNERKIECRLVRKRIWNEGSAASKERNIGASRMKRDAIGYSSENQIDCFDKWLDIEDDGDIVNEILDNLRREVGFMRTKTFKAGRVLEAEIFPYWNVRRCASRARRHTPTKAVQEKINKINVQKKISRYINANFTEEDLWGTFSYDDAHLPDTIEDAVKDIARYIKKLRYHYQKRGLRFEYLYVTEFSKEEGEKIRAHHHIILTGGLERDQIERLWIYGGRRQVRRLQMDKMGFTGLAHYFAKGKPGKMKWNHSHGLKLPAASIADNKFKRRDVEKIAKDYEEARQVFEKAYPGYELNSLHVRYSDTISGVYIYASMSKTLCADCANRRGNTCMREGRNKGGFSLKHYSCAFYRGKGKASGKNLPIKERKKKHDV